MRKSTLASLLTLFVLIPATLFLGTQVKGRWYYLISTMIIMELMLPFFFRFEARRPQAGFLTGAMAIFASNFFFSQGPWTPWQMFAYGIAGFLAGAVFHGRKKWQNPFVMAAFGFLAVLLIVGPLLDSCTVFTMLTTFTREGLLLIYGQGVPVNLMHGAGTAVTIAVLGKALLKKLSRLQTKYGMLEGKA